jgi:hypothetical protein
VAPALGPGGAFSRLRLRAYFEFAEHGEEGNWTLGGRVRNQPEAPPATGLIVPGTHGFKSAGAKIIIRNAASAGRTEASPVDHCITVAGVAVRVGAGW